jgi:hypothetical protein
MIFRGTVLVLIGLMLADASCSGRDDFASNKYSLKGIVTDKSTGKPLAGVAVSLTDTSISAITDLDGRYKIQSISPGSWAVAFKTVGRLAVETTLAISPQVSTRCDIALTAQSNPLGESKTIRSNSGRNQIDIGTISGIIADKSYHHPLVGVMASVKGTHFQAISDAGGKYIGWGVPAGTYTVTFQAVGFFDKEISGVQVSGSKTTALNCILKRSPAQLRGVIQR